MCVDHNVARVCIDPIRLYGACSVVDVARYGIERREIAFVGVWIVQAFGSVPVVHSFGTQSSIGGTEDIAAEQAHSSNFRNTLTTFARNFEASRRSS